MSNSSSTQPISKTAVDSNASSYWTEYFGPYGKMWVRQMPKRVKAALSAELTVKAQRQASKTGESVALPRIVSGSSAPLAHAVTDDGVVLEGVFRGEAVGADGKSQRIARVFRASFDHEGVLKSFRSVIAP